MKRVIGIAIPAELKAFDQWVCWQIEEREGRPTKVPYDAKTDRHARSNDPATWCSFDTAMAAYQRNGYAGVGFMFWEGDGLTGIDIDHVIDPETGAIDPRALEILERFSGTYCEVSPSGTGFRVFLRGKPGRTGKNEGRQKWLEVYAHPSHRYLTATGHHWEGSATTVTEQQAALDWLHAKYFVKPASSKSDSTTRPEPDLGLDDSALLDKARAAANGGKFRSLFDRGDTSAYGGDDSAADLALCSMLAFWTQKDAGRIDRLFRQSGLMREKWNREDYRQRTLDKAISECSEVYNERRRKGGNGHDTGPPDRGPPPIDAYGDNPEAQGARTESNFSNFSNFSNAGRQNNENASASTAPWDDPQPLRRELPPPEPFPIDALGDVLNKAALVMMEVIQSPAAICGNSLLAGASLAVQGHADIVIDGRTFPVSSYFATVADSGERKTATDDATLKPHAKWQRALREIYDREIQEHAICLAAWKKTRDEALSSKRNKTMQAKADALRELGPEPQGPVDAILMVEEPTYEGLVKALANGYPSMGLFSDEGGRFLGGHGMNAENQLKTAAGLSKLWDGSPISRTRGGDGNILLYGRRLSVHLMIQPAVSALLFGNELLLGQGLLSRFLVTWPESNIGKHRYWESNLAETPAMRRYFGRLLDILEAPLPLADGSRNELAPRQLPLSPEAKRIWIGFHDHISAVCGEGKELHPVKGLAAKGAEHAARLAGVLTLVRDLQTGSVAAAEMEAGIELAQFYLEEALRLFGASADNPDLVLAEKCLTWARNRGCPLTLPDLYQLGPNQVRDKESAKKIVSILESHGWVRPIPGGAEVNGKQRRSVWEVRP